MACSHVNTLRTEEQYVECLRESHTCPVVLFLCSTTAADTVTLLDEITKRRGAAVYTVSGHLLESMKEKHAVRALPAAVIVVNGTVTHKTENLDSPKSIDDLIPADMQDTGA